MRKINIFLFLTFLILALPAQSNEEVKSKFEFKRNSGKNG